MPTVYDELPYPGSAFVDTHPDRLATMATLFGMAPAPVDHCRVLELACGDGGNLIPMAFSLPHSSFIGVDLSGTAIARGQELAGQVGLANIRLVHCDLLEFDPGPDPFDYVITHGLYSWVPPPVRERLLQICQRHLAPQGVAYISYNAYPGGHMRDAIRRMVQFHVRDVAGAQAKCDRVRELLDFLVQAHEEQDVYKAFLQIELNSFLERSPNHFFHDELNEYNDQFYFYEFVRDIGRHGLQFISESRLISSQSGVLPPDAAEKMRAFAQDDHLVREQYLDFVKMRAFRQSLICHSQVRLDRRLNTAPVTKMLAASAAAPASAQPSIASDAPEEFRFPKSGNMSTNHPLAKAAMLHMGRIWPAAISFSDLLNTARVLGAREGEPVEDDAAWLSDMLLKLFAAGLADLHMHAPVCATNASANPVSSALVRAQLRRGSSVTSLRHAAIAINDESGRILLSLLDGTRDRAQLLADMSERCEGVTAERLEFNLDALAKLSLLTA